MPLSSEPRLGVALSGGTLKAATHIGVLCACEKAGIIPYCVAGTSAGSLVGALYAHGYRQPEFSKILNDFPGIRLLDYGFPVVSSSSSFLLKRMLRMKKQYLPNVPSGLIKGTKFIRYIENLFRNKHANLPFFIVATDLVTGRPIVFHNTSTLASQHMSVPITDLARTIAGSCALPGVFTPVELGPYQLVDGACRDYVPVSILREYGCTKILAVNLYKLAASFTPTTIVDVLARSFDILLRESIDNDLASHGDVFVIEPDLSMIKWRKFADMSKCVDIGLNIVYTNLPELKKFISTPNRPFLYKKTP